MSPDGHRSRPSVLNPRRLAGFGAVLAGLIVAVLVFDEWPGSEAVRSQLWSLNTLHYAEFDRNLPARQDIGWYVGAGPGELQPESAAPTMSPGGGIYAGSVQVLVESRSSDESIRCSTDGSIPTGRYEKYSDPISIKSTTVLRCRTFRTGYQASPTTTQTYIVSTPATLPILAVTVHPANLWNRYTGIYERYEEKGKEWEREAHVEYFPRDRESSPLAIAGKIRIHGGYSRGNQKKSFRFYYEPVKTDEYVASNLLTWPTQSNERTVVFGARESDVSRDELFQTIFAAAGGITSEKMPVFMYLNGEPWGIYYIRERIDQEYLQRRMGPGKYDLLVSEPDRPRVMDGDRKRWEEMTQFLEQSDLSDPAVFARVGEYVDLDNFIDYWLFNVYAANSDWPHHNSSMFSSRTGEQRLWRWICWDADGTFDFRGQGLHHDTFAWATRSTLRHDLRFNNALGAVDAQDKVESTLLARKLLENSGYRERLAKRLSELLATHLSAENVEKAFDELHSKIAADLPLDWERWDTTGTGAGPSEVYREDSERVRRFIRERPAIVSSQVMSRLRPGVVVQTERSSELITVRLDGPSLELER